jgi:hypothetical protein
MISKMMSKMVFKLAHSILIVLLFVSPINSIVFAQSPSRETSSKSAEEKKARDERDKKALALVDEIIRETESLRLPENRVRIDTTLADALWPRDEKRARLLFKQAVASLGEITAAAASAGAGSDAPDRDYVAQLAQQLRQEVLQVAANHDASLALDFLRATRPASPKPQPYWQPNYESQLEMSLAIQVVAREPKQALSAGEDSLNLGLDQNATNLLYSLNSQDKSAADTFLNDIMKQLRTGESSKSQAAPYIALTLLRNWVETNRAAADQSGERSNPSLSLTNLNVDTARELCGMIINEVLNSGSTEAGEGLTAIVIDGPRYYGSNPGQLMGIVQQLKPILPDIEKLSPAQFSALNKKIAESDKFNEAQQGPWAKYQQLSQTGTAEELMQAAKTAPAGVSEGLLQQAAWKAINQDDANKAHQVIERIADPRQRDEMELNLARRSFEVARSQKKLEEARALLARLPIGERATLLAQMATFAATDGDKPGALGLLAEAESLIGEPASNYQHLGVQLQIANAYEQLNLSRSAGFIEKAVNKLNELALAALVLNGFDLQQYFRNGELVINGGNQLSEMARESAQQLGSLSRHEFDRAKSVAEEFQRPEMRVMALLQIARVALSSDDR